MREITINDIKSLRPFLYIDLDCTLTKSLDPIVNILNKKYNTNVRPIDIKSWNFSEVKSDLTSEEIEEIFAYNKFFDELEFYDGAKEFLLENIDNCIIVTKGTTDNIKKKREWLDRQGLKDLRMIGLPLNVSKKFVNMQKNNGIKNRKTVFIDDSSNNLYDSNADYLVQFREFEETEWNKDWDSYILRSWK